MSFELLGFGVSSSAVKCCFSREEFPPAPARKREINPPWRGVVRVVGDCRIVTNVLWDCRNLNHSVLRFYYLAPAALTVRIVCCGVSFDPDPVCLRVINRWLLFTARLNAKCSHTPGRGVESESSFRLLARVP